MEWPPPPEYEYNSEAELHIMALGAITWRIFELITPEHGLSYVHLRHKAELSQDKFGDVWLTKACRSNRFAQCILNPDAGKGKKKLLYMYRGGGSLDALASKAMTGIVVLAKTQSFAALMLVTLHILSQCSPAFPPGQPIDLNPDLVMVAEDGFVDGDDEDDDADEEDAAAAQDDAASEEAVQAFVHLYRDKKEEVIEALEKKVGSSWPGSAPLGQMSAYGRARQCESFVSKALGFH